MTDTSRTLALSARHPGGARALEIVSDSPLRELFSLRTKVTTGTCTRTAHERMRVTT
jgi:hypothetical protein